MAGPFALAMVSFDKACVRYILLFLQQPEYLFHSHAHISSVCQNDFVEMEKFCVNIISG